MKNNVFLNIVVSFYLYKTEFNESTSWVSAENLWILGRYMVHLPLEEILKISLSEVSNKMWLDISLSSDVSYKQYEHKCKLKKKFIYFNYLNIK